MPAFGTRSYSFVFHTIWEVVIQILHWWPLFFALYTHGYYHILQNFPSPMGHVYFLLWPKYVNIHDSSEDSRNLNNWICSLLPLCIGHENLAELACWRMRTMEQHSVRLCSDPSWGNPKLMYRCTSTGSELIQDQQSSTYSWEFDGCSLSTIFSGNGKALEGFNQKNMILSMFSKEPPGYNISYTTARTECRNLKLFKYQWSYWVNSYMQWQFLKFFFFIHKKKKNVGDV